MQSFKSYYSIEELFHSISQIESNIKTSVVIEGYSHHTLKSIKKLIVLCNSISINLIQQDKLEETITLLKTSDKADFDLCQCGENSLLWQGRLITPNILSYLYFTQKRYIDSLKFIYKALSLAQEIKDSGSTVHGHIRNLMNVLTFMILWKMGKYFEAEKYIEAIKDFDLDSIRGKNLLSIVTMAKAGLLIKKKKEYLAGIMLCEETLNKLENDEISCEILNNFIKVLYSDLSKPSFREDLLIDSHFTTFFFVTCFIPLIAPGTPLIKPEKKLIESSNSFKRPAHSANRTRSEISGLEKFLVEDLKSTEIKPLTSRRSRINTSRERLKSKALVSNSLQIKSTKAYAEGSKIAYFSPRIITTKPNRPKSSKVPFKKSK